MLKRYGFSTDFFLAKKKKTCYFADNEKNKYDFAHWCECRHQVFGPERVAQHGQGRRERVRSPGAAAGPSGARSAKQTRIYDASSNVKHHCIARVKPHDMPYDSFQ
jgi:hypothetical protein